MGEEDLSGEKSGDFLTLSCIWFGKTVILPHEKKSGAKNPLPCWRKTAMSGTSGAWA